MRRILVVAAMAVAVSVPATGLAGGLEFPGVGAQGAGRAGANLLRVDDALSLHINPANLAITPGVQLSANFNVMFISRCFTPTIEEPINYQNSYFAGRGSELYAPICNDDTPFLIPQVGLSWRVSQRLGLGIGVIAPENTPFGVWGSEVDGRPGIVDGDFPTASVVRGDLIEQNTPLAYLAIGAGYQVHPRLRIGASLGVGMAFIKFSTAASTDLEPALIPGVEVTDDPVENVLTEINAQDYFVPRAQLTIVAEPVDGFEIALNGTWSDDLKSTGDLTVTPFYLQENPQDAVTPDAEIKLTIPRPLQLALGLRYASRDTARGEDGVRSFEKGSNDVGGDALTDEAWDIEFDVQYELNSAVDAFTVDIPEGTTALLGNIEVELPSALELPQNWKNQWSLRLGSDIRVIPDHLALRAGVFYETHGLERGQERFNFQPFQRIGVGAGFTARAGRLDFVFSYLHVHAFRFENDAETAAIEQLYGIYRIGDGDPIDDINGPVFNQGRFETTAHFVGLGINLHLR